MGITFFVNLHEKIILNGLHPKLKQVKQKEEIYFAIQHIFIKKHYRGLWKPVCIFVANFPRKNNTAYGAPLFASR